MLGLNIFANYSFQCYNKTTWFYAEHRFLLNYNSHFILKSDENYLIIPLVSVKVSVVS